MLLSYFYFAALYIIKIKYVVEEKKKATLKKNKDEPYDGFLKIYFGKNSIISFSGVPGIKIEL